MCGKDRITSVPGPLCYNVYNMRHWNMYNDYSLCSRPSLLQSLKTCIVQMMKALLEPRLLTLLAGAHLLQTFSLLLWTPVAENIRDISACSELATLTCPDHCSVCRRGQRLASPSSGPRSRRL